MDKEIEQLRALTDDELKRIDHLTDTNQQVVALHELRRYHISMTRNLQHERLIHLMVTILFAAVMIGSWLGLLSWFNADQGQYDLVTWLLIAAVALITGLEVGYIRYYYLLENGIAKLYPQQKAIYQRLRAMLE